MSEPPIVHRSAEPPIANRTPPAKSKWKSLLDNRWIMLLMLFGVTAALGLPFLWQSKAFSHKEKVVWSVIVSIYTLIIFWIFFKIMWWSYSNITESLRL